MTDCLPATNSESVLVYIYGLLRGKFMTRGRHGRELRRQGTCPTAVPCVGPRGGGGWDAELARGRKRVGKQNFFFENTSKISAVITVLRYREGPQKKSCRVAAKSLNTALSQGCRSGFLKTSFWFKKTSFLVFKT